VFALLMSHSPDKTNTVNCNTQVGTTKLILLYRSEDAYICGNKAHLGGAAAAAAAWPASVQALLLMGRPSMNLTKGLPGNRLLMQTMCILLLHVQSAWCC
jgi:hypothetical protein